MVTMKEYGLVFEDLSVKIVQVVIKKGQFESFCVSGVLKELENSLNMFLKEHNYCPIAIIPDTALYHTTASKTIIREATTFEKKEYLFAYENLRDNEEIV